MNRLELVKSEIDKLLLTLEDAEERREGYTHLYGVSLNCSLLAGKRGLDVEICTVIGLLHDIHTYRFGYVKDHAIPGAAEAENMIKGLEVFTGDEIGIIKTAISHHSDKKNVHDPYSEVLKDADVLQNFLYTLSAGIKHKKRLKKTLKEFGLKLKLKTGKQMLPDHA